MTALSRRTVRRAGSRRRVEMKIKVWMVGLGFVRVDDVRAKMVSLLGGVGVLLLRTETTPEAWVKRHCRDSLSAMRARSGPVAGVAAVVVLRRRSSRAENCWTRWVWRKFRARGEVVERMGSVERET